MMVGDERDAERPTLAEARRAARVIGAKTGRQDIAEHPQGRRLAGQLERAERLSEHVRGFLVLASKGIGDETDLAILRERALDIDRMWLALTRKTSLEYEIAMRFIDAIDYAAKLAVDVDEKPDHAARLLAARFPEAKIARAVFVEAISIWSRREKWLLLHRLMVDKRVWRDAPRAASLRVKYSQWRGLLGNRRRARKPSA